MSKHWNPPENRARKELGDAEFEKLSIETKVLRIHPQVVPADVDPLTVPIYTAATYRTHSVQHYEDVLNKRGYIYQRLGNPTNEVAETIINELEGGEGTIIFASGMAAITATFLTFLKAGDHLIYPKTGYPGTLDFIRITLAKFGVQSDAIRAGAPIEEIKKLIKSNTRMVYAETPCNPTMAITDLEGLGAISKSNPKILTAVDGTFGNPLLQKALKYGVNFSIHSCSKYLGGHTDLIGGAVTVNNVQLWKDLKVYTGSSGSLLSPFDSYLLCRGLRSLPLRVERHCKNAMAVATFLEQHPKITKVWYPGLKSHPQHQVAKKQMSAFGGMISFELATKEQARRVVENLKVINLAVSLGGLESLIEHPATMTHGEMLMTDADRLEGEITDGLIRLSVGVENETDLINDLKQALEKC